MRLVGAILRFTMSMHLRVQEGLRPSRVSIWLNFDCSFAARRSHSSRRCVCVRCGRQRRGKQCSMLALVVPCSQVGVSSPFGVSQMWAPASRHAVVDARLGWVVQSSWCIRSCKGFSTVHFGPNVFLSADWEFELVMPLFVLL